MRQFEIGLQQAIAAKPDFDLVAARIGFYMDVRDALVVGIHNHGVDQPHQGIVGLFERTFLVARTALQTFTLQGFDQPVSVVGIKFDRERCGPDVALLACATA